MLTEMVFASAAWAKAFRAECDPVLGTAGFTGQAVFADQGRAVVVGFVYLADRPAFHERFPDSADASQPGDTVLESDINCEIQVEVDAQMLRVWLEAWNLPAFFIPLSHNGARDGHAVAAVLGRILGGGASHRPDRC